MGVVGRARRHLGRSLARGAGPPGNALGFCHPRAPGKTGAALAEPAGCALLELLNTATEATRLGARIAVVCNADDAQIKTRMAAMLPLLTPENIAVTYQPAGCASSADDARNTCASVTVAVHSGVRFNSVIPLVPINLDLPAFATTLPREAMDSASCRN